MHLREDLADFTSFHSCPFVTASQFSDFRNSRLPLQMLEAAAARPSPTPVPCTMSSLCVTTSNVAAHAYFAINTALGTRPASFSVSPKSTPLSKTFFGNVIIKLWTTTDFSAST
jgi:hypothetical protein